MQTSHVIWRRWKVTFRSFKDLPPTLCVILCLLVLSGRRYILLVSRLPWLHLTQYTFATLPLWASESPTPDQITNSMNFLWVRPLHTTWKEMLKHLDVSDLKTLILLLLFQELWTFFLILHKVITMPSLYNHSVRNPLHSGSVLTLVPFSHFQCY